jgi:hypothetical protein
MHEYIYIEAHPSESHAHTENCTYSISTRRMKGALSRCRRWHAHNLEFFEYRIVRSGACLLFRHGHTRFLTVKRGAQNCFDHSSIISVLTMVLLSLSPYVSLVFWLVLAVTTGMCRLSSLACCAVKATAPVIACCLKFHFH